MANPYLKYFSREDILQRECAAFLRHYRIPILWAHPPNEGKRTPFEQFRMKELCSNPGIPDILIFESRGGFHGLAIELKVGTSPTANQLKWQADLRIKGWKSEVIRNKDISIAFDEFRAMVDDYIAGKCIKEGWR